MRELQFIDEDRKAELDRVSANIHYQIAQNFTEQDAEGAIKAIVEKYPGLVMRTLSKKYIKHLATLEALSTLMSTWND